MSSLIAMEEAKEGLLPTKQITRVRKEYQDDKLWEEIENLHWTLGFGIPVTILIGLVCLLAGFITFPIYCLFFLWGFLQCIIAYSLVVEPLGLLEGLALLVYGFGEAYLLYAHPYFFLVVPSAQEELANHNTERDPLEGACYLAHFYLIGSFLFFFAYYRKSLTCTLPSTLTMVRFLIFTVTLLLALHDLAFIFYFLKESGIMSIFSLLQMVLALFGFAGVLTNERQREDDKFVEMDQSEAEKLKLESEETLEASTGFFLIYYMAQMVMCTLGNVLCIILVCFGALTGEEAAFIYFHLGWAVVYMYILNTIQVHWEMDLFTLSAL